jgi:hypothetical protein
VGADSRRYRHWKRFPDVRREARAHTSWRGFFLELRQLLQVVGRLWLAREHYQPQQAIGHARARNNLIANMRGRFKDPSRVGDDYKKRVREAFSGVDAATLLQDYPQWVQYGLPGLSGACSIRNSGPYQPSLLSRMAVAEVLQILTNDSGASSRECSRRSRPERHAISVQSPLDFDCSSQGTHMDGEMPARPSVPTDAVQVTCPQCASPNAVIAYRHFGEVACFCPACEYVWDCDASTVLPDGPG